MPDLERKDAMEVLHGKWLVELGELAVMQRSEREAIKRFVSSPSDHFRPMAGVPKPSPANHLCWDHKQRPVPAR